ncbi:MAG: hypothetical protein WC438_05025 [Candidatus Pacearchaeota archaeon]
MPNKELVKFIKESRKRGFDDFQIKEPLLKHGWPLEEIEKAFSSLKPHYKYKHKLQIYIDSEVLQSIEKRAKKNMFNLNEQIEDILRRSCVNLKKKKSPSYNEKLDDTLIKIFSKRKYKK